jgi:hypothetical protein
MTWLEAQFKKFDETGFARAGGTCWECCDYVGLKFFCR